MPRPISPTQQRALEILVKQGPLRPSDLAQELWPGIKRHGAGLPAGTVCVGLVKRAKARKLDDGRYAARVDA